MKPASFWDWLGPFVLMAMFIAYLHLSTPSEIVLCRGSDDCLREWVGALSGWVAAAGAIYAARVTLAPLFKQVDEARRQTDFVVGDAEPEFVLLRNPRANTIKLRVINWNRRNAIVEAITCISPIGLTVSHYAPTEKNPPRSGKFHYRVDGWYDRATKPNRRSFILTISNEDGPVSNFASAGRAISVEIIYRVVGQTHERRTAIATAMDVEEAE